MKDLQAAQALAAIGADVLAHETAETPTVWSDRADIYWCIACSHFHRKDFEHEWGPPAEREET